MRVLQVLHSRTSLGAFPLYPRNILFADGVPCAHVLFHACCEAVFFAFGEGCAGLGDAALEAVFVEFLECVNMLIFFLTPKAMQYESSSIGKRTSTSMRAFCMAASCCTWRITAVFGSLGPNEFMVEDRCVGSGRAKRG